MFASPLGFQSLIIFLPTLVALLLLLVPGAGCERWIRWITLVTTAAVLGLVLYMACPASEVRFATGVDHAAMQHVVSLPWIESLNIRYTLGVDGISFPLIVLTALTTCLAMVASWSITRHVKAYCILLLILQTGMLGVFFALDLMLFYVFWEVMLIPMYFLIGVWGGPRREYAAIKFFLYTMFGSVLLLVAILLLYFNSDLRQLDRGQLLAAGVVDLRLPAAQQAERVDAIRAADSAQHTFSVLALQQMGQHTTVFRDFGRVRDGSRRLVLGHDPQWWAFVLMLIGFAIKLPCVPLHTWLPDAHVEAPTGISMILAAVLLKMGGYGILRLCLPICPQAALDLSHVVATFGVVSMLYGALAAMAQTDFKRMVAFSSVSHMGYVLLGLTAWSATADIDHYSGYWQYGMNGAVYQMIAHGIIAAGMFFAVGVLYDRVHHRELAAFGGILNRMPVYGALSICLFLAAVGLPGLCGFVGELFVLLSAWKFSVVLSILAAATVIFTAAYILPAIQQVYFGGEYRGPHGEALHPLKYRELGVLSVLVVLAIALGVYPRAVLYYSAATVNQTVDDLAAWAEQNDAQTVPQVAAQPSDVPPGS